MVKKTKLQANELPVDDGLDIPDFNFDFGEPKDDRSPVHKILASATQGAKDSFNDSSYIKRLLRASMPPVYGEVDDVVTNTKDNVKKLYNTAAKEIKPSLAEMARATEKLVAPGSRSASALKKIKDWAEDYKSQSMTSEDKNRIRDKNIALEIADIFSQQADLQQSQKEEEKAESRIKDSIDLFKHKESTHHLGVMSTGISRLVQYQDKITQAYQRKSLEIQYRSYFVGMESLEESKRNNELTKTTLLSIVKNTALPEFVKIKTSERFSEVARTKMMESLFGTTHSFLNKAFANVGNILKEYTDVAKDALFSGTLAAENADMMKGMSDKTMSENIAEGGAKGLVQYGALKLGGKIREVTSKNKTVNKIAGDARYGLTNFPELATEWANSQNFEDGPVKSFFKSMARDIIGNQRPDSSLNGDAVKDVTDPGMFTKFTNKSITEIIPGYLSRIFREIQILRTGDESIKLTGYDIYSNKFTDSKSMKKNFLNRLIPESAIKTHKETGKDIFALIDPENKLTDDEKSALLDKFTEDKFNKKRASYERLSSKHTYNSDPKLSGSSDKIADMFEQYFTNGGKVSRDSDEFMEKRNSLSSSFGQLGRFLNNPASEIQNLINAGYYDQLREMGLIDDIGSKINMEEVLKRHNPSGAPESFVESTTAQDFVRKSKRGKGFVQGNKQVNMALPKELSESLLENSKTLRDFISVSKEHQDRFNAFVESQNQTFGNFNTAFKDATLKVDAVTTNEILLRIEDFLVNKLKFVGTGGDSFSDPENQGYRKDSFWGSVGGVAKGLKRGLYDNIAKPLTKGILKSSLWTAKSGVSSLKWGLNKAAQGTNAIAELLIKARDIFVEGELQPRLTKAGIKAGEYYDSITNKIITGIDDLKKIKGDVLDAEGNTVLARADFQRTFVKNIKGSGILRIGESLFGKAMGFAKFSSNSFLRSGAFALKTIGAIKRGFFNLLDQPIDLFLTGTDKPILLASIMKTGGYFSEKTGRPILRPTEIDGPLKDSKGNFALTLDQLKQGLVDIRGNKIKTPMMKILSAGLGLVGMGVRGAMKISRFGVNAIKNGLNNTGELFKGMLDTLSTGLGGKKSADILVQIRDLLDDRLPRSKKRFGDKDGDGDRDGGWQDLSQNKKETVDDNSRTDPTVKADRANTFDKIADTIGSLKDKALGLLGLGDEGGGVDVDLPGGGRGRRRGKGLKGGAIRKTGRVIGKVGGAALTAAGWGGKALLGAGKFALPALASGIGGIASAAGSVLGGLGAGISAIAGAISLPVVLGAAAIGLAAYGGYKLYKHMTKVEMTPFVKLRMSQYGLTRDEQSFYEKVIKIENLLMPQVKYVEGKAEFDIDDVLIPKLLEASGIDPESRDDTNVKQIRQWTRWFAERFKPVFLTHLTAVQNTDPSQSLGTMDKMEPALKLKMLKAVRFPEGPYDLYVSPFEDLDKLQAGVDLVKYNADEAEKTFNEELKGSKEKDSKIGAGKTMATAVSAIAATSDIKGPATPLAKPMAPLTLKDKLLKGLKKGAFFMASPFAALGMLVVNTIGPMIAKRIGFGVDALEAVRYKAYGLVEMDRSKVVALRNLEAEMSDKIAFNASGSATFNGSVSEIMTKIGGDFSIGGPESKEANNWSVWFGTRFLPVYLNYMGLIKQITGTDSVAKAEKSLSPAIKLEIAKKLVATPAIWNVTVSAWGDYILNTDSNSTKENIKYLEDGSAKDKISEQKSTGASKIKQAVAAKSPGGSSSPATVHEKGPDGTYDRLPGYSNTGTNAVLANEGYRDKYDIMAAKGSDQTGNLKGTVPGSKRSKGNFSGFGEDIDTYIREASQKFGIDEKILRGFVKMEAGWTGKMSPTGAIGTGQFIQSTWDSLAKTEEGKAIGMTVIGNRFRTADDPRHDKRINTLATALLAKQNGAMLRKAGLDPTGEMLYMMHNIGPGVISAVKSGQVNGATLKAMQQNGMKSGMTPVSFVEYQKERFQDHYAAANSVSPQIGRPSQEAVPIGRGSGGQGSFGGGSGSVAESSNQTTPQNNNAANTTNGNSGSYAGSVENTKENPGVARIPSYSQSELPRENSPYKMGRSARNSLGGFDMNNNPPQAQPMNDLNRAIISVDKTAVESLGVQRQMLEKLIEISGKMNLKELAAIMSGAQPKAEQPKQAAPEQPAPQYTNARMNQSQTKNIPKAMVPMTRA